MRSGRNGSWRAPGSDGHVEPTVRARTTRSREPVWALEGNPHRRVYERRGGTIVRHRVGASRLGGPNLREVRYGWKDLRALARSPAAGAPRRTA